MAKKKASSPLYVSAGYEVGFTGLRDGYVRFPANTHLSSVTAGFWLDNDDRLATLGHERWFIMPHMITYIRKDYRRAPSGRES